MVRKRTLKWVVIGIIVIIAACSQKKREEIMSTDWPSLIKPPEQILALPGYSPSTLLLYGGGDETVEFVVYERPDEPLQVVAEHRVDSMCSVAGKDLKILEQSPITLDGTTFLLKTRLKEGFFKYSHLGIFWRDIDDDWRIELTYTFGPSGKGDFDIFDDIIANLQLGSLAPNAKALKGWTPRGIDHGILLLPNRLARKSPFRIKNSTQETEWSIDAIEIDAESSNRPLTIAPEQESPMFRKERESRLSDGFAGQLSVWSVVDAEMGVLSQGVVRAVVLIGYKVQVVLRGVGPADSVTRLETELNTLLTQLK